MLILIAVLAYFAARAQDHHIAQFAIWKPKEGQEQKFEEGYKQHLVWHKTNNDPWDWYGWYVISGARYGQFVDATFDHSWGDFNEPVKPAGDRADNELHVFPFAELQTVFKVVRMDEASSGGTAGLKSRLIRLITLSVNDMETGLKVVKELKNNYAADIPIQNFQTYKMIDGGDTRQLMIMLGFSDYAEYGKTAGLQEALSAIEDDLQVKTITAVRSETLVYRADMSLFSD